MSRYLTPSLAPRRLAAALVALAAWTAAVLVLPACGHDNPAGGSPSSPSASRGGMAEKPIR